MQYRQGDVWIERVDALPEGLTSLPIDRGRVILAYGEVTGHAHAIEKTADIEAWTTADSAERFLRIGGTGAALRHEEHAVIALPPGTYRSYQQREYTPEAIRTVAD